MNEPSTPTTPPTNRDDPARPERSYWLDREENVSKVFYAVCGACALSVIADLFVHRHGHFAIENIFASYGIYGFVCCVGLVLAAKELRKLLKRDEDYYEQEHRDDG